MEYSCPNCGEMLEIDESMFGQQLECPACSSVFEAPAQAEQPAEIPQEAAAPIQEPAPQAETPQANVTPAVPSGDPTTGRVTGFFTAETQTAKSRVGWICSIPVSILVLIGGCFVMALGAEDIPILIILIMFLLPIVLLIAAIRKMFQKPGAYFTGIRTTSSGFETGRLDATLEDVEPTETWRKELAGELKMATWNPRKPFDDHPMAVSVFIKQSRKVKNAYYFDRFILSSGKKILHTIISAKGANEASANNLMAMVEGEFALLGDKMEKPCAELLPALERAADILAAISPDDPPACTLNIMPKTSDVATNAFMFGLVGGLVSAGIDSSRKRKQEKAFRDGKLFDAAFTDRLMEFIERRGWLITVGGKPAA